MHFLGLAAFDLLFLYALIPLLTERFRKLCISQYHVRQLQGSIYRQATHSHNLQGDMG